MQFLPFFLKLTGLRSLFHKQHFTKDGSSHDKMHVDFNEIHSNHGGYRLTALSGGQLARTGIWVHSEQNALRELTRPFLSPAPKKKERIGSGYARLSSPNVSGFLMSIFSSGNGLLVEKGHLDLGQASN